MEMGNSGVADGVAVVFWAVIGAVALILLERSIARRIKVLF